MVLSERAQFAGATNAKLLGVTYGLRTSRKIGIPVCGDMYQRKLSFATNAIFGAIVVCFDMRPIVGTRNAKLLGVTYGLCAYRKITITVSGDKYQRRLACLTNSIIGAIMICYDMRPTHRGA